MDDTNLPAYTPPAEEVPREDEIVLPEEPVELDDELFDEEAGVDEDLVADFDMEETNAKEVSP